MADTESSTPIFLSEFASNHISISLSFGDIRIGHADGQTDYADRYAGDTCTRNLYKKLVQKLVQVSFTSVTGITIAGFHHCSEPTTSITAMESRHVQWCQAKRHRQVETSARLEAPARFVLWLVQPQSVCRVLDVCPEQQLSGALDLSRTT